MYRLVVVDVYPTEKQLQVISIIEKNLSYIKFSGRTRAEASAFISDNLEKSKARRCTKHSVYHHSYTPRYYPSRRGTTATHSKSDRERYEEYIEKISGQYADIAGDDGWGGFGAREIARKMHPFDEWKWY